MPAPVYNYSASATGMRPSEIRRIMKLAGDPSLISFAGGAPALSLLPTDIVDEIYNSLPTLSKQIGLQYGATGGHPTLIAEIKKYLTSKNMSMTGQELIVTAGAQQAINITAKVFLDPGDTVVTEYPSFIGALAAFKSYGTNTVGIPMDNDGIIIPQLLETLDKLGEKAKILYLTPYFHNPAGIIYGTNRKRQLLDALAGRNIILLEDDPYGELYFDHADKGLATPMKAMTEHSVTICYTGSFAKIFGPGLRLGWLFGPAEIIDKCELAKQSMDACSSSLAQTLATEFLAQNKLQDYLKTLRNIYKRRSEIMLYNLKKYMPDGVTWTTPKGGFYIWVTLPNNINASEVFEAAYKNGAAFVTGNAFDPAGIKNDCLRLSFASAPEDKIARGIEIIGNAVKTI